MGQGAGQAAGGEAPSRGLPRAKPDFDALLLVCTKCLKRQDLDRREVGRALRRAYKRGPFGRKLKVLESGCLGPCPKRRLVAATPASLRGGRLLLLDPALPEAGVAALLSQARLGPASPRDG